MSKLYAAYEETLLTVENRYLVVEGGRVTPVLEGRDVQCVAAHPARGERVFCGTFGGGLLRSTDGGDAWERVGRDAIDPGEEPAQAERRGAGADGVSVMSVAVDPTDPDVVWAGTEPSAVFRSTDGGDAWERKTGLRELPSAGEWAFPPRPYTHHVRWLEVDPADPDHVYVGVEAGALVQTRDAGETWSERPEGARLDNHSLTTHPDAPGRAWAAAGDGFAETRDGGGTWSHPQAGLDHRYCWSVAVDPADPDAVLLSSASGPRAAHSPPGEAYVYRRSGDSWERCDADLPAGEGLLRPVLARGLVLGAVYAATNRGLFRTDDAGTTWRSVLDEWPADLEDQTPQGLVVVQ